MPDDSKKVRLTIETEGDTSGAKEVEKSFDDVKKAGSSIREVLGDDIADWFEDIEQNARSLREEAKELVDDSLNDLNEATSEIATLEKLEAVERFAGKIGDLGSRVEQAGRELEDAGDAGGAAFRRIGRGMQIVSNQVATVAAGLAAGGPIGGAIAALTVLVEALFDAWADGAIRAAQVEKLLQDEINATASAARKNSEALAERNAVLESDRARLSLDQELETMKAQTEEFTRQVALARTLRALEERATSAEDRARLAEIDAEEASGRLSPAEAANQRAEIEAAAKQRQRDEEIRAALDQARTERRQLEEAEGRRGRLEGELPGARATLDDAARRLEIFTSGLENGRQRAVDLRRREIQGDDVSDERERLDRAIENIRSELAKAQAQVEVAERDVEDIEKRLDRARDDVERERSEFASAVQIADKTVSTTNRVSRAGERESRANSQEQEASRPKIDGSADAQAIGRIADSLSGVGNASGNAKTILDQALERVRRDGQVLENELPGLVQAISHALEWLPQIEARQGAALIEARNELERKIEIVENQLRNGRDGR